MKKGHGDSSPRDLMFVLLSYWNSPFVDQSECARGNLSSCNSSNQLHLTNRSAGIELHELEMNRITHVHGSFECALKFPRHIARHHFTDHSADLGDNCRSLDHTLAVHTVKPLVPVAREAKKEHEPILTKGVILFEHRQIGLLLSGNFI